MDPIAKRRMSVQIGLVSNPVSSGRKHNSAPPSASSRRGGDRKQSMVSITGTNGTRRKIIYKI
ncbi:Hypothetical predicted protein [Mytilus galloprovincialis]|uniref:Uncharacterized protein n=1 Tax=Mytilus galloprovincialis TaxID=29158 RepID=A0A8B6BIX2_MYTGA|nr:Hypothetical predicted protein [Mytilus galloprovincialis]